MVDSKTIAIIAGIVVAGYAISQRDSTGSSGSNGSDGSESTNGSDSDGSSTGGSDGNSGTSGGSDGSSSGSTGNTTGSNESGGDKQVEENLKQVDVTTELTSKEIKVGRAWAKQMDKTYSRTGNTKTASGETQSEKLTAGYPWFTVSLEAIVGTANHYGYKAGASDLLSLFEMLANENISIGSTKKITGSYRGMSSRDMKTAWNEVAEAIKKVKDGQELVATGINADLDSQVYTTIEKEGSKYVKKERTDMEGGFVLESAEFTTLSKLQVEMVNDKTSSIFKKPYQNPYIPEKPDDGGSTGDTPQSDPLNENATISATNYDSYEAFADAVEEQNDFTLTTSGRAEIETLIRHGHITKPSEVNAGMLSNEFYRTEVSDVSSSTSQGFKISTIPPERVNTADDDNYEITVQGTLVDEKELSEYLQKGGDFKVGDYIEEQERDEKLRRLVKNVANTSVNVTVNALRKRQAEDLLTADISRPQAINYVEDTIHKKDQFSDTKLKSVNKKSIENKLDQMITEMENQAPDEFMAKVNQVKQEYSNASVDEYPLIESKIQNTINDLEYYEVPDTISVSQAPEYVHPARNVVDTVNTIQKHTRLNVIRDGGYVIQDPERIDDFSSAGKAYNFKTGEWTLPRYANTLDEELIDKESGYTIGNHAEELGIQHVVDRSAEAPSHTKITANDLQGKTFEEVKPMLETLGYNTYPQSSGNPDFRNIGYIASMDSWSYDDDNQRWINTAYDHRDDFYSEDTYTFYNEETVSQKTAEELVMRSPERRNNVDTYHKVSIEV